MSLPIAQNIPEVDFNIGGLRSHSILCVIVQDVELTEKERKFRTWLLHTVFSAARHYSKIRGLVVSQNDADQERDGGLILYILDVAEQVEDCVTGIYRACMAIRRINDKNDICNRFLENNSDTIDKLSKIRNQFEHMHTQIVSGETGNGPISISLSDQGKYICFRKLELDIYSLYSLLKGLYEVVASMYPKFDMNSPKKEDGPIKMSMTAHATVIHRNPKDGNG